MNIRFWPIPLILFLACSNSYGEFLVYKIDGQLNAVFPGKPEFTGEIGEGKSKARSYNFMDEDNGMVYTATYKVGEIRFPQKDIPKEIGIYVEALAVVAGGKITYQKMTKVGELYSAHFAIEYKINGILARRYGIVVYKDGRFFGWSVNDFPTLSKRSAAQIFQAYVKYFSVD